MKMIKKIIISILMLLTLPIITNAKTYQFEIKINNFNVNNITGIFDIQKGQIKNIEMANGWENKTGLNNNFYFSASKTMTGSYLVATITVEGDMDSSYQIKNLTYHNLKCQENAYGSYYNQAGTKVNYNEYQKSCLNSNTNLKSLGLNKGTLSPAFNKDIYEYNAEVAYSVDHVKIYALTEASTSKIISSDICNLNEGTNTCKVVVKAEDESLKTYTIVINRKSKENTNNNSSIVIDDTITNFKVINADLQEPFNQDKINYNLKVHEGKTEIYFKFTQGGIEYTSKSCNTSQGVAKCLLSITSYLDNQTTTYTFNILNNEIPVINTTNKTESNKTTTNSNSNNNNASSSSQTNPVEENNPNESDNSVPELPNKEDKENKQEEIIINKEKSNSKITLLKIVGIITIGVIIGIIIRFILKKTARHHKFFV